MVPHSFLYSDLDYTMHDSLEPINLTIKTYEIV